MKCNNCGFEYPNETEYCPNCGSHSASVQQNVPSNANVNHAVQTVTQVLRDNLFLVLCILISAATLSSLFSGGFNVLYILYTIFIWLVFANSRKNPADSQLLRNLGGVVLATFIIDIVVIGMVLLAGIVIAAALNHIKANPEYLDQILSYVGEFDPQDIEQLKTALEFSGVLFLVFIVLFCAIGILIAIISYKKIHSFAKSVADSVQNGVLNLKAVTATKVWLILFAIVEMLNIFDCTNALGVISVLCTCGCNIFAYCLVSKLDTLSKNPIDIQTQNM